MSVYGASLCSVTRWLMCRLNRPTYENLGKLHAISLVLLRNTERSRALDGVGLQASQVN